MNWIKTIKNNPKKSAFGAVCLGYFGRWLNDLHENHLYRHAICQSIKHEGLKPMHCLGKPKELTIFCNPAASDGKAAKLFSKNAKPVLHLSGCNANIVKLDYEGQAKALVGVLEETDMIVCAGGDGTVNEVITGLLRRPDAEKLLNIPIAVIPLGRSNTICKLLSEGSKSDTQAQWITEMTANLFSGKTVMVDVMKVQSEDGKDAYALTDFRWGSYRDAQAKQNKYWYWGGLKKYVTYVFRALRSITRTPNQLDLEYNGPLQVAEEGAQNKVQLGPLKASPPSISLQKIVSAVLPIPSMFKGSAKEEPIVLGTNEEDETAAEEEISIDKFDNVEGFVETVEFMTSANTHKLGEKRTSLSMKVTAEEKDFEFVKYVTEGPQSVVDGRHRPVSPVIEKECSKVKVIPQNKPDSYFSIDNEDFEAFPCTVELLPNKLKMVYLQAV